MLTLSTSLKYIAHFAWDLSLGQIRSSRQKKKKKVRGCIKHFKSQAENYKICLSVWVLYVSVCVFGLFVCFAEVINEF